MRLPRVGAIPKPGYYVAQADDGSLLIVLHDVAGEVFGFGDGTIARDDNLDDLEWGPVPLDAFELAE